MADDAVPIGSSCCKANITPTKCAICRGKGRLRINSSTLTCANCLGREYVATCAKCGEVLASTSA